MGQLCDMNTHWMLAGKRRLLCVGLIVVCLIGMATCARQPRGLLRPNGVAVAADGTIYVMDRGNYRVAHLAANKRLIDAFGKLGIGPENIYYGWDIALDAAGNIYICNLTYSEETFDLLYDGIKVFAPNGDLLREIGRREYAYNKDEGNNRPYGLEVDAQGRVYVADYVANTLRIFAADGAPLGTFFGEIGAADGQFNGLNDAAVDDSRGRIYIVDNVNSRVQQFDLSFDAAGNPALTHQRTFGGYGEGPGEFAYLQYVAVDDATGTLYVSDLANRRIQAFAADGAYLRSLTLPDTPTWQVMGIAVGPDGAVYAADAYNNAIWIFEPDGQLRGADEVTP